MDLDIVDFLPKYPNININKNPQFNPYSENFNEVIYRKKEFYDNRLEKTEKFPESIGMRMKHQKIIEEFLSSYTPYDQLLLLHEMGTGKTCTAIAAIEKIKSENSTFTGAMIFARGEGLLNNFKNELIFKCTSGQYIPRSEELENPSYEELIEDYNQLTELEKTHRTNKMISSYYSLNTFEVFGKKLNAMKDKDITKEFSNKILVIDEIQNLRESYADKNLDIYRQFYRLCHAVKNSKIILMSGTPMKDTPDEIASVMNLILPDSEQLVTGADFMDKYFIKSGDTSYTINPALIPDLKAKFAGRVSYLKAMTSDVEKIFMGKKMGTLGHFRVVEDNMSKFQTNGMSSDNPKFNGYSGAIFEDSQGKGIYSNSRQAALFVFPDGSYGKDGFDKYVSKIERKSIGDGGKSKKHDDYVLKKELLSEINDKDPDVMLKKLSKFSSKYADTIRTLLKAYKAGKSSFVYIEFVKGSGAILFSKILELFGYKSTKSLVTTPGKRYSLITTETSTQKETKNIIQAFNNPDNSDGSLISVIIGSRVIGEGFSLNNVQQENILTPHWNYAETDQAIARGYRVGSHRGLQEKGITPKLEVFQRVSIPYGSKIISIDLQMYELSESKDINIKQIEKIIKESAFDCALNYARNKYTGKDGERECDYTDCDYVCDGIPKKMLQRDLHQTELDYTTFQLYYGGKNVSDIIAKISEIFRVNFRMYLSDILTKLSEYTSFEVKTALIMMINESIPVPNKYGFISYLKEQYGLIYATDSISDKDTFSGNDYLAVKYTENPNILGNLSYNDIVDTMKRHIIPDILAKIFASTTYQEITPLLISLPLHTQEMLLENCILAEKMGIDEHTHQRDIILHYYSEYRVPMTIGSDTIIIVSLQHSYNDDNSLRCLKDGVWSNCEEEYIDFYTSKKDKVKAKLETNPYGIYGQYNQTKDVFKIRSVGNEEMVYNEDKRKNTTGRVCKTWTVADLLDLVIRKLEISNKDNTGSTLSKKELWKKVLSSKSGKTFYEGKTIDDISENELRVAVQWVTASKEVLCKAIQEFLTEAKLVELITT